MQLLEAKNISFRPVSRALNFENKLINLMQMSLWATYLSLFMLFEMFDSVKPIIMTEPEVKPRPY